MIVNCLGGRGSDLVGKKSGCFGNVGLGNDPQTVDVLITSEGWHSFQGDCYVFIL